MIASIIPGWTETTSTITAVIIVVLCGIGIIRDYRKDRQ